MRAKINKVVIVGGVAGGATVATRLRRVKESLEIVLIERGEYISYANCGLPYHIGGVIRERERLLLATPESMRQRYNIDVRSQHEAISIDRGRKMLEIKDLITGDVYEESYDALVLSPGARPARPPIPGIDGPRVRSLRNMTDMDAIIRDLEGHESGRVVIAGGGFIGLELAENLHARGHQVTVVEIASQVMPNLDREMAAIVHAHLRQQGIRLILGSGVNGFRDDGKHITVDISDGSRLDADLVLLAMGVRPEAGLAQSAGLGLGPRGGILVDSVFRTQDPDIFAIGDAAEITGDNGKPAWTPLAGPANRQARLLADYLMGRDVKYRGSQGTSIAKVFDLAVASTGKSERAARQEGLDVLASITHSNSHAGYYPGASQMAIKIVFTREGRLLGGQVVGRAGVDKRIDVIAAALRLGATVHDLADLELAYAPPFGSAKDAVNVAGYVASNQVDGDMAVSHWHEVDSLRNSGSVFLDVRESEEYEEGHIEGAMHIPLHQLRQRLSEIPADRHIVVYCRVGMRAWLALRILAHHGYSASNLSGGWLTYAMATRD